MGDSVPSRKEEEFDEVNGNRFHHVRTASVILPSGDRVRRKVSLMSVFDESPIEEDEQSPLLDPGASVRTNRSSMAPSFADRGVLCEQKLSRVDKFKKWFFSENPKRVFKCALAYWLGSLATFWVPFTKFLGKSDGIHLVATVTVYFHPARTIGNMIETTGFALASLAYSVAVSSGSMATAAYFNQIHHLPLGHTLVLLVWCGLGIGFLAYAKQKLGKPAFNTACSLACMVIFVNLIRDGSVQLAQFNEDYILRILKIVLMGVLISNLVCYLFWPRSAITKLKNDMISAMDDFADLFTLLVRSFLSSSSIDTPKFDKVYEDQREWYKKLRTSLSEAKKEYYLIGRKEEFLLMARLIERMEGLGQHLGGLIAASKAQTQLLLKAKLLEDESTENSTAKLWHIFIDHLGPHLKALAFTCKYTLRELPFSSAPEFEIPVNALFSTRITRALDLYATSRRDALKDLYEHHISLSQQHFNADEIAASITYFSFSLEEFAREILDYIDVLRELKKYKQSKPVREWRWLAIWRATERSRRPSTFPIPTPKLKEAPKRPKGKDAALKFRIWKAFEKFKKPEVKFAIKVGWGAVLLALPAFIPRWRDTYTHWRIEWALLSYFVVIANNMGATSSSGFWRIVGTSTGALAAIIIWESFPANPYSLSIIGAIFSSGCFYLIANTANWQPFGRFILLTYNLIALYAYSLTLDIDEDDDDEGGINPMITSIALHRITAVIVGVLWGMFITVYIWPMSARFEVRTGLSELYLHIGWFFRTNKNIAVVDKSNGANATTEATDEVDASALSGLRPFLNTKEELALQGLLMHLKDLLPAAENEPRLKGPFPVAEYRKLLSSAQDILNILSHFRITLAEEVQSKSDTEALVQQIGPNIEQICDRIYLGFYLLSASLRLRFPVPARFPTPEAFRDRLISRVSEIRAKSLASGDVLDESLTLCYAYTLMTGQLITAFEESAHVLQGLFGTEIGDELEIEIR